MQYEIMIKTGDVYLAGTDSNIMIVLYGETGTSEDYRLNGLISGNAFERNQTDTCTLDIDDIGRVYKIDIKSDCKYGGSDWYLSNIKVQRKGTSSTSTTDDPENKVSVFNVNDWIKDTSTKTYTVSTDLWPKNIAQFETETIEYKSYTFTVPPNSTYEFSKTEKTTTGITIKKEEIKKTTKNFSQEVGMKGNYSKTEEKAKGLSATQAVEGYLKFAFSQGFESSVLNELTKTETHEISTTVKQTVTNNTDKEQEYKATFNLIRVNAISLSNSILIPFSANSEIVFAGFKLKEKATSACS